VCCKGGAKAGSVLLAVLKIWRPQTWFATVLVLTNFFKTPYVLIVLVAAFAKAIDHHLHVLRKIPFRQINSWRYHIIQADRAIAIRTNKMHMIIMMVAFGTVFTQRIQHTVISGGNGMNNAFFHKGLQRAVHGYPVKFFACLPLNIAMRERIGGGQEKRQDLFAAFGNAQVITAQNAGYFPVTAFCRYHIAKLLL
jgi:hypothetical protein